MRIALFLLFASAIVRAGPEPASEVAMTQVRGKITQVLANAAYVDIGSSRGVAPGDGGEVRRVGTTIADVEVVTVSGSQARVSILRFTRRPAVGDDVVLFVRVKDESSTGGAEPGKRAEETGEFEPLLERQKRKAKSTAERNILHGRATYQQTLHTDREGDLDYSISILTSDGMFDRIAGGPWSLRWSGNLFFRGGDAFDGTSIEGGQLIVFDLSLVRPIGHGGSLRLGRFLPQAIRSAGYLDGASIELPVGSQSRVGGAIGFRPTRIDLAPSTDEPTGLAYWSYESGTRGSTYLSGSYGFLVSGFEGAFDRAAVLLEQTVEFKKTRLDATATIDFDVGGAQFRDGTRLTQADAFFSWQVAKPLTLRAGTGHWERLDTRAERAELTIIDPLLYQNGFWRSWVGAVVVLPARLRLDVELSVINSETSPTTSPWRMTLEHFDPFDIRGGNVSLTIYSLQGIDGDGYGGLISAGIPLGDGRWIARASAGFRVLDLGGVELDVTDVRLDVDWLAGGAWFVTGGLHWLGGTALDSLLLNFRVEFRF